MRKTFVFVVCLVMFTCAATALALTKRPVHPAKSDKSQIEALLERYIKAFNARDVNGIMACYAPKDLFVFDVVPPREYPSWDAYKKVWEGLFGAYPGALSYTISELDLTVVGTVAYGHDIQTGYFTRKDGSRVDAVVRVSDVFRKIKGRWLIVQEHVSFPVDIDSAKADLLSAK